MSVQERISHVYANVNENCGKIENLSILPDNSILTRKYRDVCFCDSRSNSHRVCNAGITTWNMTKIPMSPSFTLSLPELPQFYPPLFLICLLHEYHVYVHTFGFFLLFFSIVHIADAVKTSRENNKCWRKLRILSRESLNNYLSAT